MNKRRDRVFGYHAGSANRYFFNKRKGDLLFFSFSLTLGVLMVIQPMRFIDNGRTVPQVLKASPPLSTLSSSPRSRGMHPIIGILSVSPRGDNDALPPIFILPLSYTPTATLLFPLSDLNRSQKISFIHCVPRYPVKGESKRERKRGRSGIERRMRKGVYLFLLSVSSSCGLCTPAFL